MKDEWESLAASGKLEAFFVQLLDTLNRMATTMERFDNVMNPTLGMARGGVPPPGGHPACGMGSHAPAPS